MRTKDGLDSLIFELQHLHLLNSQKQKQHQYRQDYSEDSNQEEGEEDQFETILVFDYFEHSFRSYYGLVCWLLVQVPSTGKTFLIDCLKLRQHMIELGKLTSNPEILKLIPSHSSSSTITSLQRDFSVYFVNVLSYEGSKDLESTFDFRVRPIQEQFSSLLN